MSDLRAVVVLATYDGQPHLEDQLRSLAAQTRRPDLVLVRDDGSTDGSVDLIRRTLDEVGLPHDVRVNRRRMGAAANFAAALDEVEAEADVVLLCDQDDVWHPQKVERLSDALRDGSCLAAFSNGRVVDAAGRATAQELWSRTGFDAGLRDRWGEGRELDVLLRRTVAPGATLAVRRDLLDLALPIPAPGWHDHWLLLVAACHGRIRAVDEPLVDYRLHGANEVGLPDGSRVHRLLARARAGLAADRGLLEAERAQLAALLARLPAGPAAERVAEAHVHACRRMSLPRERRRRLLGVGRELAQGRYGRYASGWRSAAVDLVGRA